MVKTREKMATRHYNDLNRLFSVAKYLCMQEMLPPKDVFIKGYPLSTLGIVSMKKFWEICLELEIVQHPFYENETKFSPFEKELYDLCNQYMYADDEGFETEKLKQKVQDIFDRYHISYKE